VSESSAFTIGVKAYCADGVCGRVTQVVLDPIADKVTHLMVEPEHRQGVGRLVPIERAEARGDHVDLGYSRAEFEKLPIAEEVRFLEGTEGYPGYDPEDLLLWPYFGGNTTVPVTVDTLPVGEVAIQRGEEVHATDGRVGEVEGLIVDGRNHHVTHFVLKEGHLLGRKEVAIPIAAVKSADENGVTLTISKHAVGDLPEVDFRRPGQ
jgi:sporulation protein YlmC with PRC-barrel domain